MHQKQHIVLIKISTDTVAKSHGDVVSPL